MEWTRVDGRMTAKSTGRGCVWVVEQRGGVIDRLLPASGLRSPDSPWLAGLLLDWQSKLGGIGGGQTEKEAIAEAEELEDMIGGAAKFLGKGCERN